MKGVIFNLLEQTVVAEHGEDFWDEALDRAALSGAYTSLGQYDDGEMTALVGALAQVSGHSVAAVLRRFGRRAMPLLKQRYSELFLPFGSSRDLVMAVNSIIHPEVRKLYPDVQPPTFRFEDETEDAVTMRYESLRGLCALAQGFSEGAADLFGEGLSVSHLSCRHDGAKACLLRLRWT